MWNEFGRARWRGPGCWIMMLGLIAPLEQARAATTAGNLVLVWREAPGASAAAPDLHGVPPAAAGLDETSITRLVPLFPAHTEPGDPLARFWRAEVAPGVEAGALAARLSADPRILSVEEDRIVPLSGGLPNDPYFLHPVPDSTQWGLENGEGPDLGAIGAWNVTTGDSTVIIGHIDSGTDWHHPEFASDPGPGGTIALNRAEYDGAPGVDDDGNGFVDDIRGWDFVDVSRIAGETGRVAPAEDGVTPDNDPNDHDGHGTFVAGILSARVDDGLGMAGVAAGCRLMPLRAGWRQDYLDPGSGQRVVRGVISMIFIAEALVYAADNGVRVINASWESDSTAALKAALDYAIGTKGVVVVNAATNGGLSETQIRNYLSRRGDCIEVCAVDRRGFVVPQSSIGRWVHLSAPGERTISLRPASFGVRYGVNAPATSWAAPHVSGVAALLLSAEPHLDPASVRARLMETATNLDARNGIFAGKIGAGMVDAAAALRSEEVNPAFELPSRPATPPAWLADGQAVFTSDDGAFVRVDPRSGEVDAFPLFLTGPIGGAAYGVIGGAPAVALTFGRGQVGIYRADGERLAGWPRPTGGLLPGGPVVTAAGRVYVAGTDSLLAAWDADGRPLAGFPTSLPDAALVGPAVGDIEPDGHLEAVTFSADGRLAVIDDAGRIRAGWPRETGLSGRIAPMLGDLDADGRLDIVVADPTGVLDAWSATGTRLPGWPRDLGAPLRGEPALADLDGDGRAEVIAARSGRLFVMNDSGTDRPGWPVPLADPPVGAALAGRVTPGPGALQVVIGIASGCVLAFEADGRAVAGWPKRLSGDLASSPVLLPGGGPLDARLAAITTAGRLETFRLPSFFQAAAGAWTTSGGDPGRTRAIAATRPPELPDGGPGPTPAGALFHPNPFRDRTVAHVEHVRSGPWEATWFTIDGRAVRRSDGFAPAGSLEITWDGRDDAGRPLPAGVYLYRVAFRERVVIGRVVHLR